MTGPSCPLDSALLGDYFLDDLSENQASAVEDHVFECDRCAAAFERAGRLATALEEIVPPVISDGRLKRLLHAGQALRVTKVEPGSHVAVEFSRDVDFLIHALQAQLAKTARVSLQLCTPEGEPLVEFEDVPFEPDTGQVLVACQRHYMEKFPTRSVFRLFDTSGGRRDRLGEYFVDHLLP